MTPQISQKQVSVQSFQAVLGIDAGSTRIKGALWTGSSWLLCSVPSSALYEQSITELTDILLKNTVNPPDCVIATGYGRKMVKGTNKVLNEIGCHARGASYLAPGCRTIIDIGGQDAKIICIQEDGKVADFAMNDKCAAGTGRFLSILAATLALSLEDLAVIGRDAEPLRLSSMCTVFAESEVIGLISRGYPVGEIVAGINDAIARRTVSLASRLELNPEIVFTGGVSANSDIVTRISQILSLDIIVPDHAEFSGAIGAVVSVYQPFPWSMVQVRVID